MAKKFYCPKHWTLAQKLAHFTAPANDHGCTLWTGRQFAGGYGAIWWKAKDRLASRMAWEDRRGPIPSGMCVCHRCDTPACVNVDHLFLGTDADNVADRDAKGRLASKLTPEQVREIRASRESFRAIARRYGVDPSNISCIMNRKTWVNV